MFKTILYPTDFSDVSAKALDYIKQLKDSGTETVIVLHVIDARGFEAIEHYASSNSLKLKRDMMAECEADLAKLAEDLEKSGFKVSTRLEIDNPLRAILKTEEEEGVSMIVIGSHGKSNLEEVFLGSVSEKVVRKCKKPVMVIKR